MLCAMRFVAVGFAAVVCAHLDACALGDACGSAVDAGKDEVSLLQALRGNPGNMQGDAPQSRRPNAPLFLVPGILSSGLEMKESDGVKLPHTLCHSKHDKWFRVWLSLPVGCLKRRLRVFYNTSTDEYSNIPGTEVRPIDFGGAGGIAYADGSKGGMLAVYNDMISSLTNAGFEIGHDLFGVPYDWRLTGDAHSKRVNGIGGLYPELQALIEKSVHELGRKAVIVSHSLGCPTMLYFLNKFVSPEWCKKYVSTWVAMGAPWGGSAPIVAMYLTGQNLGSRPFAKGVQVANPSSMWVVPRANAFEDQVIVRTPSRNYTALDFPQIVQIIGEGAGGQQALSLFAKSDIGSIQRPPRHVETHVWYGSGVPTPESFDYDTDLFEGFSSTPSATREGDGDGMINLVSCQYPEKHWPRDQGAPVQFKAFHGIGHGEMLHDPRVITDLFSVLGLKSSLP